jgi:ankyrin repeat protein
MRDSFPYNRLLGVQTVLNEIERKLLKSVLENNFQEVGSLMAINNFDQSVLDDSLVLAAWRGRLKLVKFLLDSGADIEAKGYRHKTPLRSALGERKTEVIKFLLVQGAEDINGEAKEMLNARDVDKELHLGVKIGNPQKIKF